MPAIDLVVSTPASKSIRARQVCSMFDVPPNDHLSVKWEGSVPIDVRPWNVGLIVGPSGSGKSTVMRDLFGEANDFSWNGASVLDDFPADKSLQDITEACSAVGFNSIPSWLKPFQVLSNGERFRVDLARRLVETPDLVVVDEFTSVVDRQVAKIAAHAVQKWARRSDRRFVAVSCHFDIIEWLRPDWVLEPATMKFDWRSVQDRPRIHGQIRRIPYSDWRMFAPYHYLTSSLNRAARCWGLFIDGVEHPVAFLGALHRPHPKVRDIMGMSRVVTLPDYQGLGLAFIISEAVGAAYRAIGKRLHTYPAHPSFIRSHMRSKNWKMVKRPGQYSPRKGTTSTVDGFGGRPCAVFQYIGPALEREHAGRFIGGG